LLKIVITTPNFPKTYSYRYLLPTSAIRQWPISSQTRMRTAVENATISARANHG